MNGYSSAVGKSYGSISLPQDAQPQPLNEEEDEGEEAVGEDEPLFAVPLSTVRHQVPSGLVAAAWQALVFGWFTPVVEGMQRQLELGQSPNLELDEGIPPLPPNDRTLLVSNYFEELWKQENLRVQKEHGGGREATAPAAGGGSPILSTTSSVIDETSDDETTIPRPNLVFCLWKLISPTFVRAGILKLLHDCLQFVGPQVLNRFILFLRDPDESAWTGVYLTLAVTVAQLIMSLALRHYFFACYRVGIRIRAALLLAIYRKSLTIDSTYYTTHPVGQITNLMSVDVQRLQDAVPFLHAIWYSVVQVVLALYFLWQQLGPSCLAGVAVICVSIPMTAILGGWMGSLAKELMERKDDRIQVNQELLTNMKVVKLQAWESSFWDKVQHLRSRELRQFFRYSVGSSCVWLMWSAIPLLIALGTFGAYVTIAGQALDVASALTALALFEILRFPLFMFPRVVNSIVEGKVSLTRIIDFLSAPDRVPPRRLKDTSPHMVDMMNATFSYDSSPLVEGTTLGTELRMNSRGGGGGAGSGRQKRTSFGTQSTDGDGEVEALLSIKDDSSLLEEVPFEAVKRVSINVDALVRSTAQHEDTHHHLHSLALRRIDLRCDEGEFIAVVGGVGSGKSTLLKAVLGEVQRLSGDIAVRGKVAYFDQSPFIMNDSIKGNILFGKSDDNMDLYNLAVKSCSLQHDLNMLPHGDQCEIGERGITLSGGQKARVAMARVVYQNADIALLDDCLSAVDAHVGRALFDECILNVLLLQDKEGVKTAVNGNGASNTKRKKRAVILVTNALQYLNHPLVDRIVVMKGGAVVETGSYKELLDREDSYFKSFWGAFSDSMAGDYRDGIETPLGDVDHDPVENGLPATVGRSPFVLRTASRRKSIENPEDVQHEKKNHELMTDEMAERAIGKVGRDVYMEWAQAAGGVWVMLPILLIFSIEQCTIVLSNWWLTYWSHAASQDSKSQEHFLAIYGMINLVAIIVGFLPMLCVLLLGLMASKKLFSSMLGTLLNAPMSFYDTTPAGRLMNRFSKDMYTLDESLPESFQTYVKCIFDVLTTLVVVTSITPSFAASIIPILYYYRRQQAHFSQCYRELKRIDSVTRSPIYALFGETLDGPCTIRAFSVETPLFNRMVSLVDRQQHAYYLTQAGLCWLAVRLELIGTGIIFVACMAAVYQKRNVEPGDAVFAGLAGLSISYALSVTQSLNWAVRTGSDLEANMVSVERIQQYCKLPSEAPRETEVDKTLSTSWPEKGVIEFKHAQLRYRPGLPLVLKDLTLKVPGQSKVGIVGRTGAGKSTLVTSLMRLVELSSGQILLDDVDIKTLGLRRLRSSIAVIPQDPVLFSGTVKSNLDPFDQFDRERLMDVLERVGLWSGESASAVSSLEDRVLQDGSNFSAGQRQLLVIARALLDGAGVVICDEATAAIDAEADTRIQRILRTDFAKATTLTVAHRLNTIMDSTHILVMDDGKAAEFDTPSNLLAKGGLFKDLVDKWEEEQEG